MATTDEGKKAQIATRDATAPVPPDHRLPPGRPASEDEVVVRQPADGRPGDPDALRREIEDTRARMSRTLDQIEGRLARQKEELVAKATLRDLRRKMGSEPWRTLAIAFAAGYIIAAIRD